MAPETLCIRVVCPCVRAAAGDDAFLDMLAVDFSLLKK